MRRIVQALLGVFAVSVSLVVFSTSSAYAQICDSSAGVTWDDGACGYIHPDDRVFAVLHSISELRYEVESLQIQMGFLVVIAFIIMICVVVLTLAKLYELNRQTEPADEEKEEEVTPAT